MNTTKVAPTASAVYLPSTKNIDLSTQFVRADVIFGSPKLECRGTGICKIINSTHAKPVAQVGACQRSSALLSANPEGAELSIHLFRETVCIHVYKNHLRKGVLALDAPCVIAPEVAASLQLQSALIMPGQYEIRESGNRFQITVKLFDYSPQR